MTGAQRPQDQLAELTRGLSLPLAPLPPWIRDLLVERLIAAWDDVCKDYGTTVATGAEPEVTALMTSRLGRLLDEDKTFRQVASGVVRGGETTNYCGKRIELRPDISFQLTSRDARFRLAVECKLIDHKARKGVDLYCDHGISRFVVGDYAWEAREAFMLAYVRDQSTIRDTLARHLKAGMAKSPDPYETRALPRSRAGFAPVALSSHRRKFTYQHTSPGTNPGDIAVWHIWVVAGVAQTA